MSPVLLDAAEFAVAGFGWALKEWIAFSSFSWPLQAAIGRCLGQISQYLPPPEMNVSPVLLDAAEFAAACLHIIFGTHMEALDGH